jgi:conjugative relaxase-like TrwC/TraI family protein
MRCTTLKAAADRLPGLLAYYARMADAGARPTRPGPVDYYLEAGEPPGRWWGSGRDVLGLEGEVEGAELRTLLEGRHPVGGRPLGRAFGDRSARAFDATFSAPKSVSVLWALTPDPWIRAEVLAAHDAAVDAALGWFETMARSPVEGPTASTRSTPGGSAPPCSAITRREPLTRSFTPTP